MTLATAPPPVSSWGLTWRILLTTTIGALVWIEYAIWQWQNARWWFWLDAGLGILAIVLCLWRRRHPFAVAMATNALCLVSASAGGGATWALFSLATRRRWREIIPLGVAGVLVGMVFLAQSPLDSEASPAIALPLMIAVVGVTVAWGMFTGSRRELMATLRLRADTAEAEQTARVAQARIAERNRIAREMHDVLAHRISTVAMHAGALTFRDDLDAEQVRSSAQIIQQSSHQAMVDLREVLGILRDGPGDSQPDLPQPSASDIGELVEEARRTGTNLQATVDVDLAGIPPGVGRTVYRVVQEALTNVRKHAPGTKVTLTLTGQPGSGLDLQVTNPLPVGGRETSLPSSGLGLVGLAERVQLAGGTIARHHGQRHFTLHVWLPWPT